MTGSVNNASPGGENTQSVGQSTQAQGPQNQTQQEFLDTATLAELDPTFAAELQSQDGPFSKDQDA